MKTILLLSTILISFQYPETALAEEEKNLKGYEIIELLSESRVRGEGFEQTFGDPRGHDSASTTYFEGKNTSFGRWRVEGDEYCSQWPPNEAWSCYAMATTEGVGGTTVIWLERSGRRFVGMLEK